MVGVLVPENIRDSFYFFNHVDYSNYSFTSVILRGNLLAESLSDFELYLFINGILIGLRKSFVEWAVISGLNFSLSLPQPVMGIFNKIFKA